MSKNSPDHAARRLARLASVQGLYQVALTQAKPADVIKNFRDHPENRFHDTGESAPVPDVDFALFGAIVEGATKNSKDLDDMIAGAFAAKVSAERIEILLRAILRAGAYELCYHGDTAEGVIINDYVDVAHAFFGAKEPGLVNAVLDKLAKNLRG